VTTALATLRDRKQAFHIGPEPPVVKRRVIESAHGTESARTMPDN
jgi:hypothetical protein